MIQESNSSLVNKESLSLCMCVLVCMCLYICVSVCVHLCVCVCMCGRGLVGKKLTGNRVGRAGL